jgi:hypothetical protein
MSVQRIKITQQPIVTVMTVLDCAHCGMVYGIPEDFVDRRRKDHKTFYCPSGHTQSFIQETTEEQLKRQLAGAKGNLRFKEELLETERKRSAAYKGIANKQKKAHLTGTCPVCEEHLDSAKRLTAHIKSKHPDYTGEAKTSD